MNEQTVELSFIERKFWTTATLLGAAMIPGTDKANRGISPFKAGA